MSPISIDFKKYMIEQKIIFDEWSNDSDDFFAFDDKIKNGPNVRIAIGFAKGDLKVSVYIINVAEITNPSKREYALQLVNELNIKYSYNKFMMEDTGDVFLATHIPVFDVLLPENIISIRREYRQIPK